MYEIKKIHWVRGLLNQVMSQSYRNYCVGNRHAKRSLS